ncbi:WxL domain-containing protein [Brochothrix campestris]|uniref:Cell surface protein with WxL domain n=1 Tax=Brochothrix campestris FSL F6-1037 TaxID=1265861 RepID=W7CRQ0_9LIST|nr:WxL domain-containing protein [Brochothrix campestris]EUJ35683.1 cell surface protein with WxL domain [Brochothrix campestris FSL F6-1037]
MTITFGKSLAIATILGAAILGTSATTTHAAEGGSLTSKAVVNFITNTDPSQPIDPEDPDPENPVNPIDPIDPENPVGPGTDGPLSLDFVPSLNFGTAKITTKNEEYSAYAQQIKADATEGTPEIGNYRPNYVQVTDNRGTEAGWTLSVQQVKQFASTEQKELTGAAIQLTDGKLNTVEGSTAQAPTGATEVSLVPEETINIVTAAAGQGAGVWANYYGSSETSLSADTDIVVTENEAGEEEVGSKPVIRNSAVTLSVPGASVKTDSTYSTELKWTLAETESNGGNEGAE